MNPKYPLVAARAGHICEYCRAPEAVFNLPFEIEHIIPVSRGGSSESENLALSCRSCNLYKSDSISVFYPETQTEVPFYNPRRNIWSEHFTVNKKTGEIKGLTTTAQATILRLKINSRAQLAARIQWIQLGLLE